MVELQWGRPSRDDCDLYCHRFSLSAPGFNGVVPLGTIATPRCGGYLSGCRGLQWGRPSRDDCDLPPGSPASPTPQLQWGRPSRDDCDIGDLTLQQAVQGFNGVVPLGTIATPMPMTADEALRASMGSSLSGRLRQPVAKSLWPLTCERRFREPQLSMCSSDADPLS